MKYESDYIVVTYGFKVKAMFLAAKKKNPEGELINCLNIIESLICGFRPESLVLDFKFLDKFTPKQIQILIDNASRFSDLSLKQVFIMTPLCEKSGAVLTSLILELEEKSLLNFTLIPVGTQEDAINHIVARAVS